MFKKVLVANRGEIAARIIRACRDLEITPVAVYSDLDKDSLHPSLADEAYNIGPGPAAQSYLDIAAVLEAAKRSGAEAVHPGYGFLAENGNFAGAVIDAGLAWVGPSPKVIKAMGDKTAARKAAAEAGIDIVPGTDLPVRSAAEVSTFVAEHGMPLAIKAAAGGGGKGFRVVRATEDIESALEGAAREAQSSFGSADVYLERYLARPRHVEVQVLGDASGDILSFPERDCSLQRRHQKLLEESPSPALTPKVREAIMEAAARVSRQVGYQNAGTCEFLLDSDGESFYFLEMNTRLQVEHPITELVTNVDLVRAQLLVAAKEPLELSQDDIVVAGHAIECRINAEDAGANFMPAPGTISAYREPAGPGVRVDSGAQAGTVITQAYDSLISKVITYGATRDEARMRMLRAVGEYHIGNLTTTIPFHRAILSDDRFIEGSYHTGTVETEMDLSELREDRSADDAGAPLLDLIERSWILELDGKRFDVRAAERPMPYSVKPRPPTVQNIGGGGTEVITAPMQGTIVKVLVEAGQEIKAGEPVCVLEAMKMENSILAHMDGTVEDVQVGAGDAVEAGAAIALIR